MRSLSNHASPATGTRQDAPEERSGRTSAFAALLPGLGLTVAIAIVAYALRLLPVIGELSPLIIAILLGMAFHNIVGVPAAAKPGMMFSQRRILRTGVILLGLQITATQLAELGTVSLALVVVTLTATFLFTLWLGRLLGIKQHLVQLVAAGTSICGASAVVATNAVAGGDDEDVAYAIACVTLFGTMSMFLYPMLPGFLHLGPETYGLWAGASIHEVAQVVGAAFAHGTTSGEVGTVAKLTRVLMLAPVLLVLAGWIRARKTDTGTGGGAPVPWFVFGFIAMVVLNSLITIPPEVEAPIAKGTAFLFTVALAALGLGADFRRIRAVGAKPLVLGAGSSLFIAVFSLVLIELAL